MVFLVAAYKLDILASFHSARSRESTYIHANSTICTNTLLQTLSHGLIKKKSKLTLKFNQSLIVMSSCFAAAVHLAQEVNCPTTKLLIAKGSGGR